MQRRTFLYASSLPLWGGLMGSFFLKSEESAAFNKPTSFPFRTPVVTTTVQCKGKAVNIHAISTGSVAVTRSFRAQKGGGVLSKLNILLDKHFTDYMPIWVWVIEHPDGVFIVDTGENSDVIQADYFDSTGLFNKFLNRRTIRFAIQREQEIDVQLQQLGIPINAVRAVVMTHLHLDHTDGLRHFRNTEILVNRTEWEHPYSNLPELYPTWLKPRLVSFKADQADVFGQGFPLTDAGDLLLVPTPGHTPNHSSVLMHTDDGDILFAGDTSYDQRQVLAGELAGVNADYALSRKTYSQLLTYGRRRPLVYLPSHDPEAAFRLQHRIPLVQA